MMRAAVALTSLVLLSVACVSGGLSDEGGEVGEEPPSPNQPNNTPNNTPNNDPDMCGGESCAVGRFVCIGEGEIHVCRQTPDGCSTFVLNETCLEGRVCVNALCVEAGACIDSDNDQHGLNCDQGADCDDQDPARHADADELCDGVDNDCDGIEDEGEVCQSDCAGQECQPGDVECVDASSARECRADQGGCGRWSDPVTCAAQCSGGICQDASCIDNDEDLRGEGCAFGPDCDDNNPNRFSGNSELCDGVDNDCDVEVDEAFEDFGEPCTRGQGACERSGTFRCAPGGTALTCDATPGQPVAEVCGNNRDDNCNGQVDEGFDGVGQPCESGEGACRRSGSVVCSGNGTRCDATPGQPSDELCDGVDNDCDGIADEGGVCEGCTNDAHEPDQRSSDGVLLNRGASSQGTLCGEGRDGADWVRLGSYTAGQTINLTIEYSASDSFMHMEIYDPDFAFVIASPISNSSHSLSRSAPKTGNYFLWLFPNDNPEPGISYTIRHQ